MPDAPGIICPYFLEIKRFIPYFYICEATMLHLFSQGYFQSALVFNENVTPMRTVEHYEVELVA